MTINYTSNLNIAKPNQNQSLIDTTISVADDIFDAAICGRLALSVAGSADVTLTSASITGAGTGTNAILEFTGLLTASINIIVTTPSKIYYVYNNTTGNFTLKIKTSAGTGVFVAQTTKAIVYSDGTNVAKLIDATNRGYVFGLTDAATIATDASLSNDFRVTLAGNRTLGNPTNLTDGQVIRWELIQDATGNRTLALDTKFALGTTISSTTLTTTAAKRDFLTARYNSTSDKLYVIEFVKGY